MEHLNILNTREKKNILKIIKSQWDADFKTDLVFLLSGKGNIYLINNDFARIDAKKLHIDKVGLYFGELLFGELRLSIEGSQMIGPIAKKNVAVIDDADAKKWLKGEDIELGDASGLNGFVIVKNKDDFMGCGKIREKDKKMLNYVPKTRRILAD